MTASKELRELSAKEGYVLVHIDVFKEHHVVIEKAPRTFEQAWAEKEAEGYQYGEDALEQVKFGWELAMAELIRL